MSWQNLYSSSIIYMLAQPYIIREHITRGSVLSTSAFVTLALKCHACTLQSGRCHPFKKQNLQFVPMNLEITAGETGVNIATSWQTVTLAITLRAPGIEFKFPVTWSCGSVPRPTTSSQWKYLAFMKFDSKFVSLFQNFRHIHLEQLVTRVLINILRCYSQCSKG